MVIKDGRRNEVESKVKKIAHEMGDEERVKILINKRNTLISHAQLCDNTELLNSAALLELTLMELHTKYEKLLQSGNNNQDISLYVYLNELIKRNLLSPEAVTKEGE